MRLLLNPVAWLASLILAACSSIQPPTPSSGHLQATTVAPAVAAQDIPAPIAATAMLPRPKAAAKVETYSVSVREIPAQELLFALSRDAKLNIDVHPGINGVVTLNAIDQTLEQILTRIANQVDIRWELDGQNLVVMPDAPFLRTYKVDYVNIERTTTNSVEINTQIAATSTGTTDGSGGGTGGSNDSSTKVTSEAKNDFWKTLEASLIGILNEKNRTKWEQKCESEAEDAKTRQDAAAAPLVGQANSLNASKEAGQNPPVGAKAAQTCGQYIEKTEVILNKEAGVVVVRATSRQHGKVAEYINQVTRNAGRQVTIEATIAEVVLNNNYKQGINWQSLRSLRNPGTAGFSVAQNPTGLPVPDPLATASTSFLLNYVAPGLGISATLQLLETFGNVKVLSSPKISVLNNQTAMLKVVDNIVYFEVKSNSTITTSSPTNTTVTTTAKSVAVGLVMSVTPQISEASMITLNVRPTISRVLRFKPDPNPSIPPDIGNLVPEIQTREMESVLRLADGEIAVMGGLMQDTIDYNTDEVPGLGRLPGIGNLFRNRNDTNTKTELVIFLKATVVRDPSINGDYRSFRSQLPNQEFFQNNPGYDQTAAQGPRAP
ncbi:MAG: pilus (MSHA type) biogenesis protein MshL [Rugosibacter sp.]|nr:pilus (MSHA type) biogenesis protein MshL [Rugosibacter sp.]